MASHVRPFPTASVFRRGASTMAFLLALGFSWLPRAGAEEPSAPAPWGFSGTFGTGGAGGDFGNLFTRPVSWEYNFFHQRGPWRIGIGYSFESFKMKDPYQDELEWGYQQLYLSGTRMFNMKGSVRPFI